MQMRINQAQTVTEYISEKDLVDSDLNESN